MVLFSTEVSTDPGAAAPVLVHEAQALAAALPDLLVEASQVAASVAAGWHGRRRAGPGETFWQFRPFMQGESAGRIDWRRSARDEQHLFVRETEWEAAHTVWLWPDRSPSMAYRSRLARASKRDRAIVITLALADLLARGGERIGLIGLMQPVASRAAGRRLATALAHGEKSEGLPDVATVRRFAEVVLVGDFLDPETDVLRVIDRIAMVGARAHLVQVLDPVEETFPFAGRTEFTDPETGQKTVAGRAETWREAYRERLARHREAIQGTLARLGWTFLVHHTDRPATEPVLTLHTRFEGRGADPGYHTVAAVEGGA